MLVFYNYNRFRLRDSKFWREKLKVKGTREVALRIWKGWLQTFQIWWSIFYQVNLGIDWLTNCKWKCSQEMRTLSVFNFRRIRNIMLLLLQGWGCWGGYLSVLIWDLKSDFIVRSYSWGNEKGRVETISIVWVDTLESWSVVSQTCAFDSVLITLSWLTAGARQHNSQPEVAVNDQWLQGILSFLLPLHC